MRGDKQDIIFPENNVEIMNEILSESDLLEEEEKLFDKLETDQKINSEILSELIFQIAWGQITEDQLRSELKKTFKIDISKARTIIQKIQKRILSKIETTTQPQLKKTPDQPQDKKQSIFSTDSYREPIK